MQFLKKNYEKILLGLVLAGLVGLLVFMLFYIASDEEAMQSKTITVTRFNDKALPDLNMTLQSNTTARFQSPYLLDFDSGNKVFNPMEWQRDLNNNLIPSASQIGLKVVQVTNIAPLYLIITLDRAETNELGARYVIGVEKQAEKNQTKRRKQTRYASVKEKNDVFTLTAIKGAVENPDEVELKLADSGETIRLSSSHPFQRVDGYAADFIYPPEKKVVHSARIGDRVAFGGASYIVADVSANELVLMDESNQKKTSLRFTP